MNIRHTSVRLLIFSVAALGAATAGYQKGGRPPTGEEILRLLQGTLDGIRDYTVALDVAVDLERLKVPRMRATMYFKQPDKIHFASEGFALLPKEGIAFSPADLIAKYNVEEAVKDTLDGQEDVRLTLVPKDDRVRLRRLFLDVRPGRWTAEKITAPLPDGRTMTARFEQQFIQEHWLPSRLTVGFTTAGRDSTDEGIADQIAPGRVRTPPRSGTIIITYSDYRINTGLSDDLFQPKKTASPDTARPR
jgi:hypothetical protein